MPPPPSDDAVLAVCDERADADRVVDWARLVARRTGGRVVPVRPRASASEVLDLALKREVAWVVTGSQSAGTAGSLLRRLSCPALSVPAWSGPPPEPAPRVAVVGVDRSAEAHAAARAAARLLAAPEVPARLILVHGCASHPAELARTRPWRQLRDEMRVERHGWILELAEALRAERLCVDAVVGLAWAPDLIGGTARRAAADLTGLGMSARVEGRHGAPGRIHRLVRRGTAGPLLTAAGPPARPREDRLPASGAT